jgi:hypothetical protein
MVVVAGAVVVFVFSICVKVNVDVIRNFELFEILLF